MSGFSSRELFLLYSTSLLPLPPVWKTRHSTFRNPSSASFCHLLLLHISKLRQQATWNPQQAPPGAREVPVVIWDNNHHAPSGHPEPLATTLGSSHPIWMLPNGSRIAQSVNIYWPELCVLGALEPQENKIRDPVLVYLQEIHNLVLNTHKIDGVF